MNGQTDKTNRQKGISGVASAFLDLACYGSSLGRRTLPRIQWLRSLLSPSRTAPRQPRDGGSYTQPFFCSDFWSSGLGGIEGAGAATTIILNTMSRRSCITLLRRTHPAQHEVGPSTNRRHSRSWHPQTTQRATSGTRNCICCPESCKARIREC